MAVFAVYAQPGDLSRPEFAEKVIFVREGFRFLALVLPPVYFIVHRAFLPLLVYLAGLVILNFAASVLGIATGLIILANALYAVLFAIEGAGLRQWSLRRRGYEHVGSVVAKRGEEAEMRFFSGLGVRQPPRGAPTRSSSPAGMPRDHRHALLFADAERPR